MRECRALEATSMTEEMFSMLENLLRSFHDFLHQVLCVLYTIQPPHTNNDLIKALRPNGRLLKADLARWRLDPEHGLLHGLITAYFAVKLTDGWNIPQLREKADLQRLIASCLVHDYAKVAGSDEPHDEELRKYFSLLLEETYSHSHPANQPPLARADRLELLRYDDKSWIDLDWVLNCLPHEAARFEVWAFYRFIRPALARLFAGRNEIWLRHGDEEADWRATFPGATMVSRSKEFWPNFYYPWPDSPDYWAVEVGAITPSANKPHLVDYFFPCGLITIDDYRAVEEQASIVSAMGREHELARGKIPLKKWIFVFQDDRLTHNRYLITNAGGFLTFPIFTIISDVADAVYSKLYAIG